MKLDQLKLILETFNAAGEGGKELFLWWLAKGFLSDIGAFIILGGFILGGYVLGKKVLFNTLFTEEIGRLLNETTPLYNATKSRVLDAIRKEFNK